jgi:hypothetical protein
MVILLMVISSYFSGDYLWLLVVILLEVINGYFRLNDHRLLMAIDGIILLKHIVGYYINDH